MTLRLNGSTSGYVELDAPAVAGTTALTLPATAGTVATQAYADTAGATLGGLVHINTTSFSAVSSVSINGCFSSSYDNYVVTWNATGSQNADCILYMRTSGGDETASQYSTQFLSGVGSTASASRLTGESFVRCFFVTANAASGTMWISNPNLARRTNLRIFNNQIDGATLELSLRAGVLANNNQYTGLTITNSSGTFTGEFRVYGYRNA